MPSLNSRSVSLGPNYSPNQNVPAAQPNHIPTPNPSYIGRNQFMTSSLPVIGTTDDAALRQFYGGRSIPVRRVSRF